MEGPKPYFFLHLKFGLGSSIHIVLLCERYFSFNSQTMKNLWAILSKLILFSMSFDVCFLSGRLVSFCLLAFICGMGLFKYHTTVHPTSFPWVFVVSFLGQTLVWSEWSLKIVLWTFLTLVILQGLNRTSMCLNLSRQSANLKESFLLIYANNK